MEVTGGIWVDATTGTDTDPHGTRHGLTAFFMKPDGVTGEPLGNRGDSKSLHAGFLNPKRRANEPGCSKAMH